MRLFLALLIIAGFSGDIKDTMHNRSFNKEVFLKGLASFFSNNYEEAERSFKALADNYKPLGDYVYYFLILTLNKSGKYREAIKTGERFLYLYKKSPLLSPVEYEIGKGYYKLRLYKRAEEYLKKSLLHEFMEEEKPRIYLLLAKTLKDLGRIREAVSLYQSIRERYPKDPYASLAKRDMYELVSLKELDREDLLKEAELLFKEGDYKGAIGILKSYKDSPKALLFLFRSYVKIGDYKEAMDVFKRLRNEYPSRSEYGEGLYELGVYYWNEDRNSEAKGVIGELLSRFKSQFYYIKGNYILGRIAEEEGDYKKAVDFYKKILGKDQKGEYYYEALWRTGWMHYLLGNCRKGYEYFLKGIREGSNYRLPSLYWAGRSLERCGDKERALEMYGEVVREDPDGYYGYMANKRLKKYVSSGISEILSKKVENKEGFKLSTEERIKIERIRELLDLKLNPLLKRELERVEGDNPFLFYRISFLLNRAEEYSSSIRFALKAEELSYNSDSLYRMKYPLGYWEYVRKYAEINGLDPFIIAAVIRQESLYDPESVSDAEAVGLMQIIPDTGIKIASELKMDGFNEEILKEPEINISFGTYYLSRLIRKFNGDLIKALAGYNAGEDKVERWWKRFGLDGREPDEVVEMIPYKETREYVKLVLRNIESYEKVWRDGDDKCAEEGGTDKKAEADNK